MNLFKPSFLNSDNDFQIFRQENRRIQKSFLYFIFSILPAFNLQAAGLDVSFIWGNIEFADKYRMEQSSDAGATWAQFTPVTQNQYTVTNMQDGDYLFRVIGCVLNDSAVLLCDEIAEYSDELPLSIVDGELQGFEMPIFIGVDPENDIISDSVYLGKLEGSFTVDNFGSANYSVPIAIPPGINGVQPELSLVYNSNRSNGIAGWGWDIRGRSSISRCPATLARDGYKSGVLHGEDFQYCLDGQRLVEVASNEYRTEIESYSKIVAEGILGSGPATWTVYRKDGSIHQYGHTTDSRRSEANRADNYSWHINKVTDLAGNYMEFTYEADTTVGSHRLDYIEYTKNGSSTGSQQKVDFIYESRPDVTSKYFAETLNTEDKRLSQINILSYNNSVRTYELDYQQSGETYNGKLFQDPVQTSRLNSISLCYSTTECAEPISFDWTAASLNEYSIDTSITRAPDIDEADNQLRGDFDGDGIQDILYKGDDNNFYVRAHNEAASASDPMWFDCVGGACDEWYWKSSRSIALDMNGDGKDDLITRKGIHGDINVALSGGSFFNTPILWGEFIPDPDNPILSERSNVVDMNGDALPDLIVYGGAMGMKRAKGLTFYVRINDGTRFGPREIWYDNGDDFATMLLHEFDLGEGGYVAPIEWDAIDITARFRQATSSFGTRNVWLKPQFNDMNGDGLVDIWGCAQIAFGSDYCEYKVALNTGSSFEAPVKWSEPLLADLKVFGDVNGDGFVDYIDLNVDDNVYVGLSDGKGFLPKVNWTVSEQIIACKGIEINYDAHPDREECKSGAGLKFGDLFNKATATVLADLNGDGCDDILSTGSIYNFETGFNEGIYASLSKCRFDNASQMGFTSVRQWHSQPTPGLFYTAPEGIPYRDLDFKPGAPGPEPLMNIDGQGLADLRHGGIKLQPFKIESIKYGNAASQEIDINYSYISDTSVYEKSAEQNVSDLFDTYDREDQVSFNNNRYAYTSNLAQPVSVVKEYIQSNGIGGTNNIAYFYADYKLHKHGYGSLGFAAVKKTDTVSALEKIVNIDEYLQESDDSYLLRGMVRKSTTFATNSQTSIEQKIAESKYSWQVRDFADDIDSDPSPHFLPYIVQEEHQTFSLSDGSWLNTVSKRLLNDSTKESCPAFTELTSANRVIITDIHFDAYGTALNAMENRCDIFGVTGTFSQNTNINNLTTSGKWVLGLVEDPKITTWDYDATSSELKETVRHTRYTFNAKGQNSQQIVEPNAGPEIKKTVALAYNDYGKVESVTETVTNFANDGIGFTSRVSSFNESIGANGDRTVVTTNPLNQTSTQIFEPAFGKEKSITDINGDEMTTNYDEQGRPSVITYANGTSSQIDYLLCNSCFTYQDKTVWYAQHKDTGRKAVKTFYDALERQVGEITYGLNSDANYAYQQYDSRGNLQVDVAPFRTGLTQQSTGYDYDILGRLTNTAYPNGSNQSVEYSVVDDASAATTTNTLGYATVRRYDALERERTVTDALNTSVSYRYDPQGNLARTEVKGESETTGIVHTIQYDLLGRKTLLTDPDVGSINYQYNALGLLASQTNALNQVIRFSYDKLGRQIGKVDDANAANSQLRTHQWVYDTKTNGVGKIASVTGYDTSGVAYSEDYTYLDYGLLEKVDTTIDGRYYSVVHTYDDFSRTRAVTYPTGFVLVTNYNDNGHVNELTNLTRSQPFWEAQADDALGNITQYSYGNNDSITKTFDYQNGLVNTIVASNGLYTIQNHDYDFDNEGNLRKREDLAQSIAQNFCYDELNRLTHSNVAGTCSDVSGGNYSGADYRYNVHGNLLSKQSINDYQYGVNAGPHAVTFANGSNYYYNDAGQMTSGGGRAIQYSAFGKPTSISKGSYSTSIKYGPHQQRVQRLDNENGALKTTSYIGKLYERIESAGEVEHVHYMGEFAVHSWKEISGQRNNVYFHRDHIGSIVAKTDESIQSANNIRHLANEPWGQRQDQYWDGSLLGSLSGSELEEVTYATTRGFTDHEHLDGVGLIHMNGRVYDPIVGRFVSPDPWIQDLQNSQSFNRYSYVWNNPLRYTDPTGEIVWVPIIWGVAKAVGWGLTTYSTYEAAKGIEQALDDFENGRLDEEALIQTIGMTAFEEYLGRRVKVLEKVADKVAPNVVQTVKSNIEQTISKMDSIKDKVEVNSTTSVDKLKTDAPKIDAGSSGSIDVVKNNVSNRVETPHTVNTGGKHPKKSDPNSITESQRADGSSSVTYYDEQGRAFSREDYGQQSTHGTLGTRADGRSVPHEHRFDYNDRGYPIKQNVYRELDENGVPVAPWIEQ